MCKVTQMMHTQLKPKAEASPTIPARVWVRLEFISEARDSKRVTAIRRTDAHTSPATVYWKGTARPCRASCVFTQI